MPGAENDEGPGVGRSVRAVSAGVAGDAGQYASWPLCHISPTPRPDQSTIDTPQTTTTDRPLRGRVREVPSCLFRGDGVLIHLFVERRIVHLAGVIPEFPRAKNCSRDTARL